MTLRQFTEREADALVRDMVVFVYGKHYWFAFKVWIVGEKSSTIHVTTRPCDLDSLHRIVDGLITTHPGGRRFADVVSPSGMLGQTSEVTFSFELRG